MAVTLVERYNPAWAACFKRIRRTLVPSPAALPPHHLCACTRDSAELDKQRAFRDDMRAHAEWVERLSEHKWQLARRYDNDGAAYIAGKDAMVRQITTLALAWQRERRSR